MSSGPASSEPSTRGVRYSPRRGPVCGRLARMVIGGGYVLPCYHAARGPGIGEPPGGYGSITPAGDSFRRLRRSGRFRPDHSDAGELRRAFRASGFTFSNPFDSAQDRPNLLMREAFTSSSRGGGLKRRPPTATYLKAGITSLPKSSMERLAFLWGIWSDCMMSSV